MDIQTTVGALDGARKAINFAIPKRTHLPVLGCIVLTADKYGVFASATDLEVTAMTGFEAEHKGNGTLLVDAKELATLCKGHAKTTPVKIRTVSKDGKVGIEVGKVDKLMTYHAPADYPQASLPGDYPADACTELDGYELRSHLRAVIPACSTDETRPILTGVFVEDTAGGIEFVGCDSYRLHVSRGFASDNADGLVFPKGGVVIPARVLKRVALSKDSLVDVAVVENEVHIYADGVYSRARLIEGQYSNWQQLMSSAPPAITYHVDRDEWFKAAVEMTKAVGKSTIPARILTHELLDTTALVWVRDGEGNETKVPVGGKVTMHNEENAHQWGVNPYYLADALSCFRPGDVTMTQINPLRPLQMSQKDGTLQALVMPVRIADKDCTTTPDQLPAGLLPAPKKARKAKAEAAA